MNDQQTRDQLKSLVNSRARIAFSDGEIVVCKLDAVIEDENMVILTS